MVLEKGAEWDQAILPAIQFRMLCVLSIKLVSAILCGCEIWCLTSREEHRLRVCEKRVLRRIFGVRGRWEYRDAEDSVVSFMSLTVHQIFLT